MKSPWGGRNSASTSSIHAPLSPSFANRRSITFLLTCRILVGVAPPTLQGQKCLPVLHMYHDSDSDTGTVCWSPADACGNSESEFEAAISLPLPAPRLLLPVIPTPIGLDWSWDSTSVCWSAPLSRPAFVSALPTPAGLFSMEVACALSLSPTDVVPFGKAVVVCLSSNRDAGVFPRGVIMVSWNPLMSTRSHVMGTPYTSVCVCIMWMCVYAHVHNVNVCVRVCVYGVIIISWNPMVSTRSHVMGTPYITMWWVRRI